MNPNSDINVRESDVEAVLSTDLFDADNYLKMYPDVYRSGFDPLRHYLYFGHRENRNPSPHFDTVFYRSEHMSDVEHICPLVHYARQDNTDGVALRSENSISLDLSDTELDSSPSLAIHIHLFYAENFDEIIPRVKALPANIDLLISTSSEESRESIEHQAKLASLKNRIEIRVVENVGRDMAPLFVSFADAWSRYDYICHLHSKQSPHTDFGHRWRNYLFDQVIGSQALVSAIISLFEKYKKIGVIYPENYFEVKQFIGWNSNREYTTEFLRKIGFEDYEPQEKAPDFAAGSMCWMRTSAYTPVNQGVLSSSDFEEEQNQLEGTLAHVLERCLAIIPRLNGFRAIKYFNDIQDVEAYRAAWSRTVDKVEDDASDDQVQTVESTEDTNHVSNEHLATESAPARQEPEDEGPGEHQQSRQSKTGKSAKTPPRFIFITGMHRSGTSMLARLLNLHGCYLPLELEYSDEFNQKGYWESFEIQKLNDELLRAGDSTWFDLRAFSLEKQSAENIEVLRTKFAEYIDRIAEQTDAPIVIKDPRICRLLPFWKAILDDRGHQAAAIFPFRNPLEVAESIRNRDGFRTRHSLLIWLRNVLEAEAATRDLDRVVCSYTRMISDWPGVYSQIATSLGLADLKPISDVEPQVAEFISGSLRHWAHSEADLENYVGPGGLTLRVYRLLDLLETSEGNDLEKEFDGMISEFNERDSVLGELQQFQTRVEETRNQFKQELDGTREKLETAREQVHESHALLGKQGVRMEELDIRLGSALQSERDRKSEIEGLETELSGLKDNLAKTELDLEDKSTKLAESNVREASLSERLAQSEERISIQETDIAAKSAQLAALQAKKSELNDRLIALREETSNRALELENAIESRSRDIDELRDMVAAQSEESQRLWRDIADRDATIENIGKSLSWKITAPLRFAFDWLVLYPLRLARNTKTGIGALVRRRGSPDSPASAIALVDEEARERRFVEKSEAAEAPSADVRLLAFYLPQFHPIPENDEWWGEGFTEWTNVTRASPLFNLHHQPRVPVDLGYYDLREIEVQKKQVELAKQYGLGGFCFYFYWFHGVRLLETPLLQYLENPDLDLPFCMCWANENWTRTWDGLDSHMLIGQEHSDEDDLAFIEYLSRYIQDSRYIRVDRKPLLLVYRPSLLPDPAQTAERWRQWCRENGVGEIYLAYPQSFEREDPAEFGFDAAIEFPPNNTGPDIVTHQVKDLPLGFKGYVYDWTSIANRSEAYTRPDYTLFRGVNPSWDNTARRPDSGAVFVGTTPDRYQRWLENAIRDTRERFDEPSERLVFINAWNEWAEGAYLEPDAENGYAYLQATRNALQNTSSEPAHALDANRKIILVAHDGHPHGAQYLMLYTARCLKQYFNFEVDLVVLGEGILVEEFEKWATVHSLAGQDHRGRKARALAESLAAAGHTAAICNTTVSGLFLETLSNAGLRCISLVHELSNVIRDNQLEEHARSIAEHADKVVFAATQVRDPFLEIADVPREKTLIRFQGNYKKNAWLGRKADARKELRKALGLPRSAKIVLGAGYLDHRKGVDLYVEAGLEVCRALPEAYFVWIGHWEIHMEKQIRSLLDGHDLEERFIFPGRQDDTDLFFAGADIFALTSREDPFPTTVMEALEVATPVIGFAGAGGSESLISKGCGTIVPMEDYGALASAFTELLKEPDEVEELGEKGAQIVHEEFSFPHYVYDLLELAGKPQPKVSAIVPNFNYERHLEQRLRSIFEQTFPVYELIVLDDASTDKSVEVIEQLLGETEIHSKLIVNEANSGSVFRQWAKGVNLARGDMVWICEADDFAAREFLEECVEKMDDGGVVLSFAQSGQVNESGKVIEKDYLDYTSDVCNEKWRKDYVAEGMDELKSALSIKNTVPNVSGVVFKKQALEQCLATKIRLLEQLKIAGDWLVYSEMLKLGKIAFSSKSLNFHRRHEDSVTIRKSNNSIHMAEILFMQSWVSRQVEIEPQAAEKAKQFVKHAYGHLELDKKYGNWPDGHPEVKKNLERLNNLV